MSDGDTIFDELENSSEQPDLGGGYADWWDLDDEPSQIIGPVVEIHSAPEKFTESGEVPDPIYTVVATGRGGFDRGQARCTKTHAQVVRGLEGAEVGDLVNLKHTGHSKTDGGNFATDYEIGVIVEDVWGESGDAEEIQELIDGFTGQTGDNRRTEPFGQSSGQEGGDGGSTPGSDLSEAGEFLDDLLQMQGGEMPEDNAENMLHDVRGFDEELADVAEEIGASVQGGTLAFD